MSIFTSSPDTPPHLGFDSAVIRSRVAALVHGALSFTAPSFSGPSPLTEARRAAAAIDWELDDALLEDWCPPAGPAISALALSGIVEAVEDTRVTVVARQAADPGADELVIHVPMRLVPRPQRQLIELGAHVEWRITQTEHASGRIDMTSEFSIVEPKPLSDEEFQDIQSRAAAFDAVIPDLGSA